MDYTTHYLSTLGPITLASDGAVLCGLWFDGQKHFASSLDMQHEERTGLPIFDDTRQISHTNPSAKSVGNAVGHNNISLITPCHASAL